ncbi:sugar lactone lactonase YvrE [Bradyrhizobium elkanii]|nr:sugar lactone lactonase YvrE [Bradyrhizobium elkanii]
MTECRVFPDGVAVDADAGHVYWTNMGVPEQDDGSVERVDLDGRRRKMVVEPGVTRTPKQLCLHKAEEKLYWSDRDGMRVMHANLDGSAIETLIETGRTDAT